MKIKGSILAIIIAVAIAQWFFPWWSMVVVLMLAGVMLGIHPGKSFLLGFAMIAFLWSAYAGFLNHVNTGMFAEKVGGILSQGKAHIGGTQLIYITGLLGGLLGGLGMMTGSLGSRLIKD